jgi:dCMP deaminase
VNARPDWHTYFIGIAGAVALRGDCRRSQVGAVLVNGSPPRQIGAGYNGVRPGRAGCLAGACPRGLLDQELYPPGGIFVPRDDAPCIATHAEWNALDPEWTNPELVHGSTMYISREPCESCASHAFGRGVWALCWIDSKGDVQWKRH